jgi:hypothetical protein
MPSSSEDDDDDADETAQPASAAPKAAPADASQASSGTDADEHKRSRRCGWLTFSMVLTLANRCGYLVGVGGVSVDICRHDKKRKRRKEKRHKERKKPKTDADKVLGVEASSAS